jgi:hypothetical protein
MSEGPVLVTWRDAFYDFDQPDTEREDYLVQTVGFVISYGPLFLRIGSERLPEGDGYRSITRIPLGCVEAVETLYRETRTNSIV